MTTSPRWEHQPKGSVIALAARSGDGVALRLDDGTLQRFGDGGAPTDSFKLPPCETAARLERHAAGVLAACPGEPSLVHHNAGRTLRIAMGGGTIDQFASNGEHVVVVRGTSLELWTLADQCRWQKGGGPFVAGTIVGRTVVALRADGEMVFFSAVKGSEIGTLKLAGTEPPHTWQLAAIDATRMALGMGEWLVVIEAASQKVLRRTRVRAGITALAANERRLVAGLTDGWVQIFDAFTSDSRGSVQAHDEPVVAVAIDGKTLFSAARSGPLRAWDGGALEASKSAAPVSAVTARHGYVAVGDRAGRVRLLKGVEEVGSIRLDGPISGLHIGRDDSALVAAGSVLVKLRKPWKTPEPILLSALATAFAADDAYAFAGTEQGSVDVYDLDRSAQVTSYALTDASITGLVRLPGACLVVGTSALDGRLFIIDVAQAKVLHRIDAHQEAFGVTSLAADLRGRIVASGSDDGSIALIDPAKGRVLARIRVPETPTSLAFEATGKKLAAVLANGATMLVELDRKGAVSKIEASPAMRVAWDDALVVGLGDGRVERPRLPQAASAGQGAAR